MSVFILSEDSYDFPSGELAEKNGLLAIGGDLSVKRLVSAYKGGIFPWYEEGADIEWWCPNVRFIIFPKLIRVSGSMRKFIKKTNLQTKIDENFPDIIRNCKLNRADGTWITKGMEDAYINLFEAGYGMCVGVYDDDELVGGLYGVKIGKCFFGESMFSRTKNASKLALIRLCVELYDEGFLFVDCQFHTDHLESMGGQYISWFDYSRLLKRGVAGA